MKVDRSKVVEVAEDGWKLTFRGNKIQLQKDLVDVSVTYEQMIGGLKIVISDDLVVGGMDESQARMVVEVAKSALENMGFEVDLG